MRREELIEELGLGPVWKLRPSTGAVKKGQATPAALSSAPGDKSMAKAADASPSSAVATRREPPIATGEWTDLLQNIRVCRACSLCEQRKQTVPGAGALRPDWLIVGEGPGVEEDENGEPFAGQAGKLLDSMLAAIGLRRGEGVYIANAVKCRPPSDRPPTAEEIAACRPFLERQVELLLPRIILLLGRAAAHSVLGGTGPLTTLRGTVHRVRDIPTVVTFHPAYLLRSPTEKARAWEDLCLARRTLRELSR